MTADLIARALPQARRSGSGWVALCPVHEADGRPHTPSLSITERSGKVLVHCQAGCSQSDLIAALRALHLWPEPERPVRTAEEKRDWAREQRELERDLPAARYWRRTAAVWAEEALVPLKAACFDAAMPAPDLGEIQNLESLLAFFRRATDAALVSRYRLWSQFYPWLTSGMVGWARNQAQADLAALERYWQQMEAERQDAK